jgi:hypothetical protein
MSTIHAATEVAILPRWPQRTVAVLSTVDEGVHAIPVSAPVRVGDRRILLSLHRSRDTLGRIRRWPEVALTVLARLRALSTGVRRRYQPNISENGA